jgi:hypothetical protein
MRIRSASFTTLQPFAMIAFRKAAGAGNAVLLLDVISLRTLVVIMIDLCTGEFRVERIYLRHLTISSAEAHIQVNRSSDLLLYLRL